MRQLAVISILIAARLVPAVASEAERYRDCTAAAQRDPIPTLTVASAWRDAGGGVAAEHCLALVLTGLERYEAAAKQFEQAAAHARAGQGIDVFGRRASPEMIGQLFAQAGNAWLLADNADAAYIDFSTALSEVGTTSADAVEILIDRARALALAGNFSAAVTDLDQAQLMAPSRAEIYLYRASARRHLKELDDAAADIANALSLDGADAAIALEAGDIAAARGDYAAARGYWLKVVELADQGPSVDAARANLAALDVADAPN